MKTRRHTITKHKLTGKPDISLSHPLADGIEEKIGHYERVRRLWNLIGQITIFFRDFLFCARL
jgi:hypothetical protein